MDEWENGLSDEYEQEESSELQRELALEREAALDLEIERDEQRSRAKPEPPAKKKLKRELEQEAWPVWNPLPAPSRILKTSLPGGTGWTPTGNAGSDITRSAAAVMIFR